MRAINSAAQQALTVIRGCLAAERFRLTPHFRQRLADRGLLWVDVLTVFDLPTWVRPAGEERYGRSKWKIAGKAADGLKIEMVCVLDRDVQGHWTIFVTSYFD